MAFKSTAVEMRTPRGVAIWPKLNTPDTKYDPAGTYEVKLAMDANDPQVKRFFASLEKMRDEHLAQLVKQLTEEKKAAKAKELKAAKIGTVEVDNETGEETGRIILKAKMKASGISKKTGKPWSRKPAIFDAKGTELKNPPTVGGGSELKLSVSVDPFLMETSKEVGVSVRLEAVQVLKLVKFGGRDFGGYGFEAEDGDELQDEAAPSGFADESGGGDAPEHDDL